MTIKLKDIIPAPWNTRGEITPESVKELAESIKEQGLINPLTVWMNADGDRWFCIAGHRRLAALRSIGADETECIEFKGTANDAKMVTVTENLQREDVGPIEEAALVAECLDAGMTAESIAAKTGRSTSWVNRRRKLITLDDCWKANTTLPVDALEKIAAYPAEVQKAVGKNYAKSAKSWEAVKWSFERESRSLDGVKWETKNCRKCLNRTGVEADLFGITDGDLGSCLDCKCFDEKRDAFIAAKVAEATKGATEKVECHSEYWLPSEDESSPKKSKKHPCAYYFVDDDCEVTVRWGESQKAKKDREAAEAERVEAERKAKDKATAAIRAVADKLQAWAQSNEDEDEPAPDGWEKMMRSMFKVQDDASADWMIEVMQDSIISWHNRDEWADIIRAFPEIVKLAGLTDAERDTLLDAYPENDENETEN